MTTVNAYIRFEETAGGTVMACRCGHELGPATESYKRHAGCRRYPVSGLGPYVNPHRIGGERFEAREYFCPSCLVLFELEVALEGDPELHDVQLRAAEPEEAHG